MKEVRAQATAVQSQGGKKALEKPRRNLQCLSTNSESLQCPKVQSSILQILQHGAKCSDERNMALVNIKI